MTSSHVGQLPLSTLSASARQSFVVPGLQSDNLFSLPQIADDGCTTVLQPRSMQIYNRENKLILEGTRPVGVTFWSLSMDQRLNPNSDSNLTPQTTHIANTLVHNLPVAEKARFYRDALLRIPDSTLLHACHAGFLRSFPGLTTHLLRSNVEYSTATAAGHLAQARKHRGPSRKPANAASSPADTPIVGTTSTTGVTPYVLVLRQNELHADKVVALPSNNSAILIVVHNNYIALEIVHSGSGAAYAQAYGRSCDRLVAYGVQVNRAVIDNEFPIELKRELQRLAHTPHFVPPSTHRRNIAERAIQTVKHAILGARANVDSEYPVKQRLHHCLELVELVVNLVRPSASQVTISAWEAMRGPFDYSQTPFLPYGMKVTCFTPPSERDAWQDHGVIAFFERPLLNHFRCYEVYVRDTQSTRKTDSIATHPPTVHLPGSSPLDLLLESIRAIEHHLASIILKPPPAAAKTLQAANDLQAVTQLYSLFNAKGTYDPTTPSAPPLQYAISVLNDALQRVNQPQLLQSIQATHPTAYEALLKLLPLLSPAARLTSSHNSPLSASSPQTVPTISASEPSTAPPAPSTQQRVPPAPGAAPSTAPPAPGTPQRVAPAPGTAPSAVPQAPSQQRVPLTRSVAFPAAPPASSPHMVPPKSAAIPATSPRVAPILPLPKPYVGAKRLPSEQRVSASSITTLLDGPPPGLPPLYRVTFANTVKPFCSMPTAAQRPVLQPKLRRQPANNLAVRRRRMKAAVERSHFNQLLHNQTRSAAAPAWVNLFKAYSTVENPPPDDNDMSPLVSQATILNLARACHTDMHPLTTLPEFEHIAWNVTMEDDGTKLVWTQLNNPAHSNHEFWDQANAEEFDRQIEGTDTIEPMLWKDLPPGATVSYVTFVPSYKKDAEGQPLYRVRMVYGGDRLKYVDVGNRSSQSAALSTLRVLWNDVLSTPQGKFMTADLKDFFLQVRLKKSEYISVNMSAIPESTQLKYQLANFAQNGKVLFKVKGGMYGLPHVGRLSQDELHTLLTDNGYQLCPDTPATYIHPTNSVKFTTTVDDFAVRYVDKADAEHLLTTLQSKYDLKVDWEGKEYLGISLKWDYENRTLHQSMPDYCAKGVARFRKPDRPYSPKHAPGISDPRIYGRQPGIQVDESPLLDAVQKNRVSSIIGYFLWYGRCVDPTMLVALGQLASQQSQATTLTEHKIDEFLDYCETWPNATVVTVASDMILRVVSDCSDASEPGYASRAGGLFYLTNKAGDLLNGGIDWLCALLDVVVASAAEGELGAMFMNARLATSYRACLQNLGWPQPPTVLIGDNKCATGIANDTVKQKRSRAMDRRFFWIVDRVKQGQFDVQWQPGVTNLADYLTKLHPAKHHRFFRKFFVHDPPDATIHTAVTKTKKTARNSISAAKDYLNFRSRTPSSISIPVI